MEEGGVEEGRGGGRVSFSLKGEWGCGWERERRRGMVRLRHSCH